MRSLRTEGLAGELEGVRRVRPGASRAERLLDALAAAKLEDAESLVRVHDAVLFLRAYPHGPGVLSRADALLDGFGARVAALARSGADLSPLDEHEASGISGTAITMAYSHGFARWLAREFPGRLTIAWSELDAPDRLAALLPRVVPLLDEEALADANVAYRAWLDAVPKAKKTDAEWLLGHAETAVPPALFDALALPLRWELGDSEATRTRARRPVRRPFFHEEPLLTRRDVSLAKELADPAPLPVRRLSRRAGEKLRGTARAAMGVRYRELYGFTHGDPGDVTCARAGRGTEIFVAGLPPGRRLPIRAGYAALVLKNGVPVAYGDAFALFERLDVSFNVFYAFRDGESAWTFARLLRVYRQLLGSTLFSVDPYQIGKGNDEAIASGAFWFYRKLGFASTDPALEALARREEARLAADPKYRTSSRTLTRLAGAGLVFGTDQASSRRSDWDGFHFRDLALGGRARGEAPELALVLSRLPRTFRSRTSDRALLDRILDAKARRPEAEYLRLLQGHARLREPLLALGRARQ